MDKLLELLEKLVRAIFGPGDEQDAGGPEPTPQAPKAEAVTGWEGDPPYRYIDVSRWQGIIKLGDWVQVEAAGYKGVMLRAIGNRNGVPYIDPTFEDNYINAKAAGLDIGVYYYTKAITEKLADEELAALRQALRGKELTLPVALDMEDETLAVLKPNDLTNLAAYHLEQIEKMGFFAQLYTYTSYANVHLDMARLSSRWDVWLADYTGKTPKVDFAYNAHQHTSKGSVPGINGVVDLDVTTVNYPRIIKAKGLTRLREA
ncbi:MAG: glycosyl hydrolase family 25 [Bacteriophage sp.]|nr:MAG: glycosyl hydrolase family 25 [Bacteriophage sp.]